MNYDDERPDGAGQGFVIGTVVAAGWWAIMWGTFVTFGWVAALAWAAAPFLLLFAFTNDHAG